ncbi:MAG TPA: hypothetical protein VN026_06015, partial [Bacteroidia bacterium]|nr:hypothetical protein [Bacteroidia bacterium]
GILHIHIKAGSEIELTDAVQAVEAEGILGGGKKYPVLIDCGEFASVDKEARVFSASPESKIYTLSEAIAFVSFGHKLIADFYIKHNKPSVPTKSFPTREEAIRWLKTFKSK